MTTSDISLAGLTPSAAPGSTEVAPLQDTNTYALFSTAGAPQFKSPKIVPGKDYPGVYTGRKLTEMDLRSLRRNGIPENAITRFDPNSFDFEDSINWSDITAKNTNFLNCHPICPTNLGLSSELFSTYLRRKLREVNRSFTMYSNGESSFLTSLEPELKREFLFLLGRKEKRPETHYSAYYDKRENTSVSTDLAAVMTWLLRFHIPTAASECTVPTMDSFSLNEQAKKASRNIIDQENQLINIYEIYGPEPALCLTYLTSSRIVDTWRVEISHVWFSFSNPLGDVPNPSESMGSSNFFMAWHVLGGLPRFILETYCRINCIDLKTMTVKILNNGVLPQIIPATSTQLPRFLEKTLGVPGTIRSVGDVLNLIVSGDIPVITPPQYDGPKDRLWLLQKFLQSIFTGIGRTSALSMDQIRNDFSKSRIGGRGIKDQYIEAILEKVGLPDSFENITYKQVMDQVLRFEGRHNLPNVPYVPRIRPIETPSLNEASPPEVAP